MDSLNVAVVQLCSTQNLQENLAQIDSLFKQLSNDVDLISLPENALQFKVSSEIDFGLDDSSEWKEFFVQWAKKLNASIHIGGAPLKIKNGVANSTFWVSPDGSVQELYRKIHLFDVDLPNLRIFESETFESGNKIVVANYLGWKLGFGICYDIRFTPFIDKMIEHEVDIAFFPAAFTQKTGEAHWEILNRARAIEMQSYVVSAAQSGTHRVSEKSNDQTKVRKSFGQSLIVDPWGEILQAGLDFKALVSPSQTLVARLEKEKIRKVRSQMPIANHRKKSSFYSQELVEIDL